MRKPENFEKIDDKQFHYGNCKFKIEEDWNSKTGATYSELYIFELQSNKSLGDYCAVFMIHWDLETFTLRKCVLGQGLTGEDIFTLPIPKNKCKTLQSFLDLIKETIVEQIKLGSFSN